MAQIVAVFRIGRDAEIRFTQSGEPVASLSLAFNYGRRGNDGKRPSQWIEASLWGKRAESLAQYLTKGSSIFAAINDPHVETYLKKDGTTGVKLVGNLSEIELVGGRAEGGATQPTPEDRQARAQRNAAKSSFDDLDDDIPF